MREIKFRAWDKEYKEWISDTLLYYPTSGNVFNTKRRWLNQVNDENVVLMQYTGLKDKNGKELFSNDIVSDGINSPFVTELWNFPLMVRLTEIEFEVIGNVFENPELLNNK